MSQCLIAVGANLGDRSETIERAVSLLRENAHFGSLAHSAWRETPAVGGPADQPAYLNGAISVTTALSPLEVLAELQKIEQRLGRDRRIRWGARTIDLDLLLHNDVVLSTPELTLPHPRMAFRKFVVEPAAEVAPEMRHPQIGWTMRQLYNHLLRATPYVAITGAAGIGKSRLAAQLAESCGARRIEAPVANRLLRETIDAPGSLLGSEIEWLQRVGPLVRKADWPEPSRLTISDFWLEQTLAFGSVALTMRDQATISPADREVAWRELLAVWTRTQLQAVPPKLLVLADPPSTAKGPWQDAVQQAIVARCEQPGLGPVLRLTSADRN